MRAKLVNIAIVVVCLCAGATPGVIGAQIGPTPNGPVDYGPTITDDRDKLGAVNALIYQAIEEYNRQVTVAKATPEYGPKFLYYEDKEFRPRMRELLAEAFRLREAIKTTLYPFDAWDKLSFEEQQDAWLELFGNKSIERVMPTVATASVLDELKAVDLASLPDETFSDPVEDFTEWTEVDPGSDLTISGASNERVTWSYLPNTLDTYLYYDKGSGYYDGDFEFHWEGTNDWLTGQNYYITMVSIANVLNDWYWIYNNDYTIGFVNRAHWTSTSQIALVYAKTTGGTTSDATGTGIISEHEVCWYEGRRVEGSPTYIEMEIYEDDQETLIDTLYVEPDADDDFRYVFTAHDWNSGLGGNGMAGYVDSLDLLAGGAPPAVNGTSFGYILGG